MKDLFINKGVPLALAVQADKNFVRLCVELALRKNNEHVGSGRGGNNFQLLVLMHLDHYLVADATHKVSYQEDRILWGAHWLAHARMLDIRIAVDDLNPNIKEWHKYEALMFEALSSAPNLREAFREHAENFPYLMDALMGKETDEPVKLTPVEMLVQAFIVCQELAHDLDKQQFSYASICDAANILSKFSPEIILFSVRKYIGIERLVVHDLDEHPAFSKVIKQINDIVL